LAWLFNQVRIFIPCLHQLFIDDEESHINSSSSITKLVALSQLAGDEIWYYYSLSENGSLPCVLFSAALKSALCCLIASHMHVAVNKCHKGRLDKLF
jgi:hypothetical protein